ncbi:MAG: hypothetical protein AAGA66_17870 [Bacteroidota bacterium]
MESSIEQLLEKYWKGETSLDEERVVKKYFQQNPTLSKEADYFRFLTQAQRTTFDQKPSHKGFKKTWLSAAATVTIGVITAVLVLQQSTKDPFAVDDPKEALEATKKALMLIGMELNEGQSYTMEITKINKGKEELKDD